MTELDPGGGVSDKVPAEQATDAASAVAITSSPPSPPPYSHTATNLPASRSSAAVMVLTQFRHVVSAQALATMAASSLAGTLEAGDDRSELATGEQASRQTDSRAPMAMARKQVFIRRG